MESNIRAAITGGTGFLGAALANGILDRGGEVAVLARKDSPHRWRLPARPGLVVLEADLERLGEAAPGLRHFGPEVFFHLGWIGVGNRFRNDPVQVRNILATADAVRLAAECGCRRWVGTGSLAEYGPLNRRISEADPMEPTTLYGACKVAAWALARVLGAQAGLETVWARVFSTYGPGDDEGWMLTKVIGQLLAGERPSLTAGAQAWDYLHVADAAEALLRLGTAPRVAGAYNLGSGQARTIRAIVEMTRDLIDPRLPLGFGEVPYRPDQVMHLEADISRLRQDTGWSPAVGLEAGIAGLIQGLREPGKPNS